MALPKPGVLGGRYHRETQHIALANWSAETCSLDNGEGDPDAFLFQLCVSTTDGVASLSARPVSAAAMGTC